MHDLTATCLFDAPRAGSAEAKMADKWKPSVIVDAPRAGSAEAKVGTIALPKAEAVMHPVQAAPRQSFSGYHICTETNDAPRAGSAEAKCWLPIRARTRLWMHPVQAAPRQRWSDESSYDWCFEMHPVQAAPRQSHTAG